MSCHISLELCCLFLLMSLCTSDWAFQGVDLAFFDTLMRGAGAMENNLSGETGTWEDWETSVGIRWRG